LQAAGFRVSGDYRPEKIGAKIRAAQLELIPYMFIIGGREMEEEAVSVRDRIDGDLGSMKIPQAIDKLKEEVANRVVRQVFKGSSGLGTSGTAATSEGY